MANKKQAQLFKWLFAILCIVVIGCWLFRPKQNVAGPVQSNNSGVVLQQENISPSVIGTGSQSSLSKEENLPSSSVLKEAGNINAPNQPESNSEKRSPTSAGAGQAENGMSDNQLNAGAVANSIPTEAEVIASINLQNQQRQALAQVLSDRTDQITRVHEAILASLQGQNSSSQDKPVEPALLDPPDDVVQKLKSHLLMAH